MKDKQKNFHTLVDNRSDSSSCSTRVHSTFAPSYIEAKGDRYMEICASWQYETSQQNSHHVSLYQQSASGKNQALSPTYRQMRNIPSQSITQTSNVVNVDAEDGEETDDTLQKEGYLQNSSPRYSFQRVNTKYTKTQVILYKHNDKLNEVFQPIETYYSPKKQNTQVVNHESTTRRYSEIKHTNQRNQKLFHSREQAQLPKNNDSSYSYLRLGSNPQNQHSVVKGSCEKQTIRINNSQQFSNDVNQKFPSITEGIQENRKNQEFMAKVKKGIIKQQVKSPSDQKVKKQLRNRRKTIDSKCNCSHKRYSEELVSISSSESLEIIDIEDSDYSMIEEELSNQNSQQITMKLADSPKIYIGQKEYEFVCESGEKQYTSIYFYICKDQFDNIMHHNVISNQSYLKKEFFYFILLDLLRYLQSQKSISYCVYVDTVYYKIATEIVNSHKKYVNNNLRREKSGSLKNEIIAFYQNLGLHLYTFEMDTSQVYQEYLNCVSYNRNKGQQHKSNEREVANKQQSQCDLQLYELDDLGLKELLQNPVSSYLVKEFLNLFQHKGQTVSSNNFFLCHNSKPLKSFKDFDNVH